MSAVQTLSLCIRILTATVFALTLSRIWNACSHRMDYNGFVEYLPILLILIGAGAAAIIVWVYAPDIAVRMHPTIAPALDTLENGEALLTLGVILLGMYMLADAMPSAIGGITLLVINPMPDFLSRNILLHTLEECIRIILGAMLLLRPKWIARHLPNLYRRGHMQRIGSESAKS